LLRVDDGEMRTFWDARARENALYFIDNQLDYADPDLERFFANGTREVETILDSLGAQIEPSDELVEIGCGAGRQTRALAERAASVRALDISERMLERARELNGQFDNVEWILGDGSSLAGVDSSSADVCFSHVVFQHIPDPAVTLGYVREMGRVLRPGGWAAFHVSNDEEPHRRRGGRSRLTSQLRALLRRGPRGQAHPAWLGSAVRLSDLRRVASDAGMDVERVVGEGSQFCFVLVRKRR
jgi:SAM-dependent methyltransferase